MKEFKRGDESYTITAQSNADRGGITLLLNGKFQEGSLSALEQLLAEARKMAAPVYVDLSEVTLVDRKAAEYLSRQAVADVELINCPVYLQRWIAGETRQEVR